MDNRSNDQEISYSHFVGLDFYKEARDDFLLERFGEIGDLIISSFELSFLINKTAKNAPLLYLVLESLPQEYYKSDKNYFEIRFESEENLFTNIYIISDILAITKTWATTTVTVNHVSVGATTEFGYIVNLLFEKNGVTDYSLSKTVKDVKGKYKKPTRAKNNKIKDMAPEVLISRNDVSTALKEVVSKYTDLYCQNKEMVHYYISEHDIVISVEDSLVVDFRVIPIHWAMLKDFNVKDWEFPYILIQEITKNELFKFNFSNYRKCFKEDFIGIEFLPFRGFHCYNDEIDNFDFVNKMVPELDLQDKAINYGGEQHHFIILRMETKDGKIVYGVGNTKGMVYTFILKLCKELEEKNSVSLRQNGASCLPFIQNRDFIEAFLQWEGKKKRWRLENKFSFFVIDKSLKSDLEISSAINDIIASARKGAYNDCEYDTYNKPSNKWKSEELVYSIVKKLYRDYQVVYQYRPLFLNTGKGINSYDIYICGLRIAIEYQGKQHFEPVDFFGGQEHYQDQHERDLLKAKLSKDNGVSLVYVNYWEDISSDLIRSKVEQALSERTSSGTDNPPA